MDVHALIMGCALASTDVPRDDSVSDTQHGAQRGVAELHGDLRTPLPTQRWYRGTSVGVGLRIGRSMGNIRVMADLSYGVIRAPSPFEALTLPDPQDGWVAGDAVLLHVGVVAHVTWPLRPIAFSGGVGVGPVLLVTPLERRAVEQATTVMFGGQPPLHGLVQPAVDAHISTGIEVPTARDTSLGFRVFGAVTVAPIPVFRAGAEVGLLTTF